MFHDGQTVRPDELEHWIAVAYPHVTSFKAKVEEREETYTVDQMEHRRVRVTISILTPSGEPVVSGSRRAVYYALKDAVGMPQIAGDWAA